MIMSQESDKKTVSKTIYIEETLSNPPIEPVTVSPFPEPITKGLSPPPVEPITISPFVTAPPQTSNKSATDDSK